MRLYRLAAKGVRAVSTVRSANESFRVVFSSEVSVSSSSVYSFAAARAVKVQGNGLPHEPQYEGRLVGSPRRASQDSQAGIVSAPHSVQYPSPDEFFDLPLLHGIAQTSRSNGLEVVLGHPSDMMTITAIKGSRFIPHIGSPPGTIINRDRWFPASGSLAALRQAAFCSFSLPESCSRQEYHRIIVRCGTRRPGATGRSAIGNIMQVDIQKKLRQLLAGDPINDEMSAVYLLVEVRKILEHDQTLKVASPTLEFYCNWGIHVQLDRAGARRFLNDVEPILTMTGALDKAQHEALDALLTLDAFRLELRSLLASFGADLAICDDPYRWDEFLRAYSKVVQDSELSLKGTCVPTGPLGLAVKTVTVRPVAGAQMSDLAIKVYPMVWMIEYEDGRIGRLTLSGFGLLGATVDMFSPAPVPAVAA
jgi:hypothetical protein